MADRIVVMNARPGRAGGRGRGSLRATGNPLRRQLHRFAADQPVRWSCRGRNASRCIRRRIPLAAIGERTGRARHPAGEPARRRCRNAGAHRRGRADGPRSALHRRQCPRGHPLPRGGRGRSPCAKATTSHFRFRRTTRCCSTRRAAGGSMCSLRPDQQHDIADARQGFDGDRGQLSEAALCLPAERPIVARQLRLCLRPSPTGTRACRVFETAGQGRARGHQRPEPRRHRHRDRRRRTPRPLCPAYRQSLEGVDARNRKPISMRGRHCRSRTPLV